MDWSRKRMQVVEAITDRVSAATNRVISQDLAVRIAVCCALRNPEEALTYMTNRSTCEMIKEHVDELRISIFEFGQFFGFNALPAHGSDQCVQLAGSDCVRAVTDVVETALRYALAEQLQSANWRKPLCRLSSVIAMEMEETSEALGLAVGTFGESDARRLSDAREHMEEEVGTNLEAVDLALNELLRAFGIG